MKINARDWMIGGAMLTALMWITLHDIPDPNSPIESSASDSVWAEDTVRAFCAEAIDGACSDGAVSWRVYGDGSLWMSEAALARLAPDGSGGAVMVPEENQEDAWHQ